jgi:hypothetical protein
MMLPKIKSRTIIVLFTIAATSAASFYVFRNKASAAGLNGSIFTTTFDGQSVNENIYSNKDAVYLSGGPQNDNASGLPDGSYYFQVTDPSGATLLSSDAAECRQLTVFGGRVVGPEGPSCLHASGIPNSANGATPVKLAPFADTPNSGSEYKVWLIRKVASTTVAADGMRINFSPSNAKTDNFKVLFEPCTNCQPTSLLGGRKFYDANANALFDEGEAPVAGVQIAIIAGDTTTIVTTNASGQWSTTVPTGVEYLVLEILPYTGPEGEPGSFWQQTSPVADDEGFQFYRGTVNGDQTGLDFGNICFNPDSQGNPLASASPCSVSDLPPPEPTPTPTPTPCPDCATTAVLSGAKFYDANANSSFDPGEVPVVGVQILVVTTTGDGTVLTVATTDASGNWSLTVPIGAQYIIGEDLPFTDPAVEPEAYWEQTAPVPNGEGFRGYQGTVSGDQAGLNFGDICYHFDTGGNPIASSTPCSVWYPPAPPTPTPTPTPEQ